MGSTSYSTARADVEETTEEEDGKRERMRESGMRIPVGEVTKAVGETSAEEEEKIRARDRKRRSKRG